MQNESRAAAWRPTHNGYVLWEGTSLLDEKTPIVVIATGFTRPSINRKTGPMIQTWILNAEEDPHEATKSGADEAVCGDCPFRGGVCYVEVARSPSRIYGCYKRGGYPTATDDLAPRLWRGRQVRFGAYGDPAAAPFELWEGIADLCDGFTGYTHQWRQADPRLAQLCMASVDDPVARLVAKGRGYRTFRVAAADEGKLKGEAICPASDEAGKKLQCSDCMACHGVTNGRRGDVVIRVHGAAKSLRAYEALREPLDEEAA